MAESLKYELLGVVRHSVSSGIVDVVLDRSKPDDLWISIRKIKLYPDQSGVIELTETRLSLAEMTKLLGIIATAIKNKETK